MSLGLAALKRAERTELAASLARAIHARKLRIEGRRDAEAEEFYRSAPSRENVAELLGYAAHLYAEWGKHDKAEVLIRLRDQMLGKGQPKKEAAPDVERLARELQQMREQLAKLQRELNALRER
jgi:hypothetical protein